MTATAPQERLAKTTSWLGQLRVNAEWAGFTVEDAERAAQERYGKAMDELTVSEAKEISGEFAEAGRQKAAAEKAARTPQNGPHSHPCFQCERPVTCNQPDCRKTAAEHRHCHEGYSASEWSIYHYKHGEGFQRN